jgi:hypothetical protein
MADQIISQEYLREIFDYRDGKLYWKKARSKIQIGKETGSLTMYGYYGTKLNGKFYKTHRLIFMWHYGFLPSQVDHINGIRNDNRIENLRPATNGQNQHNAKIGKNNTSGIKGVYKHKNKWRVRLMIDGVSKSFGLYNDIDYAKFVADAMRYKYHQEFARTK